MSAWLLHEVYVTGLQNIVKLKVLKFEKVI